MNLAWAVDRLLDHLLPLPADRRADAAWAEATDLGKGDKAFFIEDNVFEATERSFALDGWKGQRVVVGGMGGEGGGGDVHGGEAEHVGGGTPGGGGGRRSRAVQAATLRKRYERVLKRINELDSDEVFENFMNAYSHVYDPHSNYLSPRNSEEYNIAMSLSYEGIGASLQLIEEVFAPGGGVSPSHWGFESRCPRP